MSKHAENLVFSTVCYLLDLKASIDTDKFDELQEILSLSEWNFSPEIESLIGEPAFIKKYQEISKEARCDDSIPATLQQIVQCIELLDDLQEVLEDEKIFKKVVEALQFDNPSKTHSEVTEDLGKVICSLSDSQRLNVRRIFTERAVTIELGFGSSEFSEAQKILRDEELYIDVLNLLYQNVTRNYSWENTLDAVIGLINSRNPESSEMFEMFLWFHHAQQTSSNPENWYEKYCEYTFNMADPASEAPLNITDKLQTLNLNNLEGPAV